MGFLLASTSLAFGLPSGRAWAPVETLLSPSGPLISPRLEIDSEAIPLLFGGIRGGGFADYLGFSWNGSSWVESWQVGRGLNFSWPVWPPPGEFYVIGQDPYAVQMDKAWFWLAHRIGNTVEVENVVRARQYITDYSAAVSTYRRWLLYNDGAGLHILYSDLPNAWVEVPTGRRGGSGLGIAALDDTTALLAWANSTEGLHWATLQGSVFTASPDLLGGGLMGNPTFRRRPSGGYWMGYATGEPYVLVRSFMGNTWSSPETLSAVYRSPVSPQMRYSDGFEMSRDEGEYPAVAWGAFDGSRGVEAICVSVPTDTGWTVADQLENDEEGILPTVARDGNGDVWVAFWRYYTNGIFWAHTYTKATTSTPIAIEQGPHRLVTWTLSETAPETWWAVLRAQEGGDYEPVARVRAGNGVQMSWRDENPPPGNSRYRIRRECVDTRYQWTSEASDLPVAAITSLVNAQARPGEVSLTWLVNGDPGVTSVHRRTPQSDWAIVGKPSMEGSGLLTYVDRGLGAGRYAYRLGFGADGGSFTPEVWLDVVSAFSFALHGFRPNPAVESLKVAFSLATNEPAKLEVYDINGRRVLERDLGALGAGPHLLDLRRDERMPPGVYWIRLIQSGQSRTAKGILLN